MSAAFAPHAWPMRERSAAPLGRELVPQGATGSPPALRWRLKRNCSVSPSQLGLVFASLCAVSLSIGLFFLWHGAPFVLGFAGLEVVAVGLAMLVFARHAGDRETLTLVGASLLVEQCIGHRVERSDFAAGWTSVEPAAGQGSLIEISGQGRTVRVGRFLRPELRADLAQDLRAALRRSVDLRHPDPN